MATSASCSVSAPSPVSDGLGKQLQSVFDPKSVTPVEHAHDMQLETLVLLIRTIPCCTCRKEL